MDMKAMCLLFDWEPPPRTHLVLESMATPSLSKITFVDTMKTTSGTLYRVKMAIEKRNENKKRYEDGRIPRIFLRLCRAHFMQETC